MSDARRFDLNVERVLEHWTTSHAIRELIANALDESVLTATREPVIEKSDDRVWQIRDWGRGLEYRHLTQRENPEKTARSDELIGKFGVGLKDSLAALDRHRVRVLLQSRHADFWIDRSKKHGFEDLTTLHVAVAPPTDPSMVGTLVVLDGVTEGEVLRAKDFFLRYSGEEVIERTDFGDVVARGSGGARIYVNGLVVAEEDRFLFSYNVRSLTKGLRAALNRERTNVGRTAYADRVRAILKACRSDTVVSAIAHDLSEHDHGESHDEVGWQDVAIHACKALNSLKRAMFVTSWQLSDAAAAVERARSDGIEIVVVPDTVQRKLGQITDLQGAPIRDLGRYLVEWNDSFEFAFIAPSSLTEAERVVWANLDTLIGLVGKRPSAVKTVAISETMRPTSKGSSETVGLWEPALGRIVVKRSQLQSSQAFAATVLHELGHVRSGADHFTDEFEDVLTDQMGTIAVKALGAD